MPRRVPPFAGQRIIYFGLLFGMTAYAIGVAVILQMNDGKGLAEEPIPQFDTIASTAGAVLAGGGILMRFILRRRAERLSGNARAAAMFTSVLVPLLILESGCLLATTAWMLTGNAVPGLAVALVLLAIAIAIVPLKDPDAV